jgi:type III pantothenate kinase
MHNSNTARLLCIDIGNSQISIGCFEREKLEREFLLKTDTGRTADEYAALLLPLLEREAFPASSISSGVVCSVVPQLTAVFSEVYAKYFAVTPLVLGPGCKTGIALKIAEPSSLGPDRLANAVAVRALYGSPALVVDFGTATSFDVVGADGAYLGGAIAPGVLAATEGLISRTARLPHIELQWPKSVLGRTTAAAMQSGSMIGYMCLVDGLISRLEKEVGTFAYIVATGHQAKEFISHSERLKTYEPALTLHGMRLVAEMQ